MSSFINTRRHFDSIAAGIKKLLRSQDFYPPENVKKHLPGAVLRSPLAELEQVDKMVARLLDLQIISVCCQYPSGQTPDAAIEEQRLIMERSCAHPVTLAPIPLHKAISCALYQIEPQYVEKYRPLTDDQQACMSFFEEFQTYLAGYIVTNTTVYQAAAWAIKN